MVLYAVIGCSKRCDHDKDVSFHRLPAMHDREGKEYFELGKKTKRWLFGGYITGRY